MRVLWEEDRRAWRVRGLHGHPAGGPEARPRARGPHRGPPARPLDALDLETGAVRGAEAAVLRWESTGGRAAAVGSSGASPPQGAAERRLEPRGARGGREAGLRAGCGALGPDRAWCYRGGPDPRGGETDAWARPPPPPCIRGRVGKGRPSGPCFGSRPEAGARCPGHPAPPAKQQPQLLTGMGRGQSPVRQKRRTGATVTNSAQGCQGG